MEIRSAIMQTLFKDKWKNLETGDKVVRVATVGILLAAITFFAISAIKPSVTGVELGFKASVGTLAVLGVVATAALLYNRKVIGLTEDEAREKPDKKAALSRCLPCCKKEDKKDVRLQEQSEPLHRDEPLGSPV